jgi:hypothetical protein
MSYIEHSLKVGEREYTIQSASLESAHVFWKAINPQTGKAWQKTRDDQVFSGKNARAKGMVAWTKAIRLARKK